MGNWQSTPGEHADFYVFSNHNRLIVCEFKAEYVKFVHRRCIGTWDVEWEDGSKRVVIADFFKRKTHFITSRKREVAEGKQPPNNLDK